MEEIRYSLISRNIEPPLPLWTVCQWDYTYTTTVYHTSHSVDHNQSQVFEAPDGLNSIIKEIQVISFDLQLTSKIGQIYSLLTFNCLCQLTWVRHRLQQNTLISVH